MRTRELPAALETARRHPGVRFVIDHVAKPPIAGGDLGAWAAALAPFADLPNVSCKLSGLVTEADWSTWTVDDLEPCVRLALSWFGAGRCLLGSPMMMLATARSSAMKRRCFSVPATTLLKSIYGLLP